MVRFGPNNRRSLAPQFPSPLRHMRGEGVQAWSLDSAGAAADDPEGNPGSLNVAIYPFPLCAFGIPNSVRAYIELYASGPGSASGPGHTTGESSVGCRAHADRVNPAAGLEAAMHLADDLGLETDVTVGEQDHLPLRIGAQRGQLTSAPTGLSAGIELE